MAKKLLFFIESLEVGGAEKSLVTLLNSVKFQNYSIDLMMLKGGTFLKEVPGDVNIIFVEDLHPSIFKRFRYFIAKKIKKHNLHQAQYFWEIFKNDYRKVNKKYDVAIAYSQGFATYFVGQKIDALQKYAWVNIDYKKAGYDIEFDFPFYEKFNKIVAVSKDVEKGLFSELKKIGKNLSVEVIKDITDRNRVRQHALKCLKINFNDNVINIVTVCRLVKQKGLFLAVQACSLLKKKNYKINWYVIGEGSERKNLQQLIIKENLQNSFFLLGADPNPYPYMKACDIYVQTSLFEGLGLTVIEASYLNKPIVCTNFPTVYDILVDEKTGLIVEMDSGRIVAKIERLILDKGLRDCLSGNLEKVDSNDKETTLQKFEKLLLRF